MKRLVLTLSDDAFEAIKSETAIYSLVADWETLLTVFAGKMIRAIEDGKETLEIKTCSEREEESCPKP